MVKKRRKGSKKITNSKEKVIEDPDPDSEEFMYDEVEKFHRSKDKLLLDPRQQEDKDSEVDFSEEEEEVLDVGESLSEEESNEDGELDNSDLDVESKSALPSDQAWGKRRSNFYNADVEDADIYASDEEAELAAREEEVEARTLQNRMAERLDDDDFLTIEQDKDDKEEVETESVITKDLSKLSKQEKLELLNQKSPELLPLMKEYQDCLKELKDCYDPLLKKTLARTVKERKYVQFIQTKHQLLMNYLVNISFYLALKANKNSNLKGHPITDVLLQHKKMLKSMETMHEIVVEKFMTANSEDESEEVGDSEKSNSKETNREVKKKEVKSTNIESYRTGKSTPQQKEAAIDPLEYYNAMKRQLEKKKKNQNRLHGDEKSLKEESRDDDDGYEIDEEGKRKITYEMEKNKGLTRHRRKELRNPRVKHKMKYKKAKIKRKGQVKEIQHELLRYGGELTGIKSNLTRSVRIK